MESYTTPLDEEETNVDEYQVFKEVTYVHQNLGRSPRGGLNLPLHNVSIVTSNVE